jgi:NADPH-dependent curcumin reductase
MADRENLQIRLASRPYGRPTAENFTIQQAPVPAPGDGQVLISTRYLSLDPYMRGRMSDAPSYAPPVAVGGLMVGGTVGEVVESRDPSLKPGDVVLAYAGWQKYAVQQATTVRKLDPSLAPVTTALGVLGMPGFTAYAGLTQIGRPQAGETVVVAAASGPVGATVGQLAKIFGARAVGIAGGPEKVPTCARSASTLRLTIARRTSRRNWRPPRLTGSTCTSRTSADTYGTRSSRG